MKASPEFLEELHAKVCEELLDKIKSGKATPQHLAAAIKFLKDNHIEGDLGVNKPLVDLTTTVFPDFQDDEFDLED